MLPGKPDLGLWQKWRKTAHRKGQFRGFGLASQILKFSKTQAKKGVSRGVSNSQIKRFFQNGEKQATEKASFEDLGWRARF